jgi:glycine betaine/proline transport system ATP-binding protein
MQQRVGLARALAVNPEILLMDEPFSALDPLIRREMQDELLRLQAELKKTIVFITHDLDEALRLGDRIAIMRDGEIIQLGVPEEIIENPVDSYVEDFIRSISRTRVLGAASIMKDSEVVLHDTQTTKEVLNSLSAHKEDYAFILDNNGKLSGVADKDDLQNLLDQGENSIGTVISVDPPIFNIAYSDTPIDELVILSAMSDCPIAVTDGENNLLGVVSRGELLHSIAESQQAQQGGVVTPQ